MAGNIAITPGSGASIAADDVAGVPLADMRPPDPSDYQAHGRFADSVLRGEVPLLLSERDPASDLSDVRLAQFGASVPFTPEDVSRPLPDMVPFPNAVHHVLGLRSDVEVIRSDASAGRGASMEHAQAWRDCAEVECVAQPVRENQSTAYASSTVSTGIQEAAPEPAIWSQLDPAPEARCGLISQIDRHEVSSHLLAHCTVGRAI